MARRNGLLNVAPDGPFVNDQRYPTGHDRWVFGILVPAGPTALNMVSNGLCPLGKPVEPPDCLRPERLPLRPPGR